MSQSRAFLFIISLLFLFTSLTAQKSRKTDSDSTVFNKLHYRSIGPTRASGRFVDIAVSSQHPTTFYAASSTGGLLKTENNGISFVHLFTDQDVFSIGAVAIAPTDENVLYLGSGEGNNSRSTYWGDGVYKSTDAGKSWKNVGLTDSHHIGRIVIHPKDPDIVYVAALGHLYSLNEMRGLYKTSDGGQSWQKVLAVQIDGRDISVVDVAIDPINPDILYACSYDRHRRPWTYDIGGPGSGIYKSSDAGKSWKKLETGLPSGLLGRIGIAVYQKNPAILYACVENVNKKDMSDDERWKEIQAGKSSSGMIDGEVFRSEDAGEHWSKVTPDNKSIGGAPAYYYGRIIIDPTDEQIVHVLSASSWSTYDGGKTWKSGVFDFGGDDHALWIDPTNNRHLILGYDHGLGISYDGGKNWYHPDNLSLAQCYAIGVDMAYPYHVGIGLQDNGSWVGPNSKPAGNPILIEDWKRVGGGDGMYNVFDWKTNRYLYNESQFGPLSRLDLLTGEQKDVVYKAEGLRFNWNAPILVSPHHSDVIYHGANKILKSTFRGESWIEFSPDLTHNKADWLPNKNGGDGNIQYCTITSIDESPIIEGQLWVGTDDGRVWVRKQNDWINLDKHIPNNPGYWVSRVSTSPHNSKRAYVSFTGFRNDDFRPLVYRTDNLGESWTLINQGLPMAPINVIREDVKNPDLLFIGSELGVYVSINGGKEWVNFELDMPRQPVHDLLIHPRENDLVVATHGRGVYITDISAIQELKPALLNQSVHLFAVESKIRWVDNHLNATSSINYQGESEANGLVIYHYLKEDSKEEVSVDVFHRTRLINEIKAGQARGINRSVWDMTERIPLTESEKEEVKKRIERYKRYGYDPKIDQNYKFVPVKTGCYRFVLKCKGQVREQEAQVLPDPRFNQ